VLGFKSLALVAFLALAAVVAARARFAGAEDGRTAAAHGSKAAGLRLAERRLWNDHAVWTRQYIVAAVAGSPDAHAAAGRLMKNQEDLGNAIAPYFGAGAARTLTKLLKDHVRIAAEVVAAVKSRDGGKLEAAGARWRGNARDIAAFLSGANPVWKRAEILRLLEERLRLTTAQTAARLSADWQGDVAAFDSILEQALGMADVLSDGIVKRFPSRF
jgi:hypothetical protein